MVVRFGVYEGRLREGGAERFYGLAFDELLPALRAFPGCVEASVLRPVEVEAGAPGWVLALSMRYPDRAACDAALQSQERLVARAIVARMLEMFEGSVHHYVFDEKRRL